MSALLVFAASSGAWALARRDGRGTPATARAEEAVAALRRARSAGGAELAPLTLGLAWEAYEDGLRRARVEELRPAWLRDHRAAARAFDEAIRLAGASTGAADMRVAHERRRSAATLGEAAAALRPLEGVEAVVWIPTSERRQLQSARRLLASASTLFDLGEHEAAVVRAREVIDLARPLRASIGRTTSRFSDPERLAMWRSWVEATVRASRETGSVAVIVQKDEHRLVVYEAGRVRATYAAELGWNNTADKLRLGDGATPEGRYFVTARKDAGASRYHRALLLDYPSQDDWRRLEELARAGVIDRRTRPGGLIELHGSGGRGRDWTDGCVALTDRDIEALFDLVTVGTPVTIVGSHSGSGVFADVATRLADR